MKQHEIREQFMHAAEAPPRLFLPQLCQPKLNGFRARYMRSNRAFYSKDGIRYSDAITDHIVIPDGDVDLDGEFYCHGMSLAKIASAITPNRKTPTADTLRIKFYAFDVFDFKSPATERAARLEALPATDTFKIIPSVRITSHEQLEAVYADYVAQQLEGAMYRWPTSKYVPGRSLFLHKRKAWTDAEFMCIGYERGTGEFKDTLGSFVCELPNGGRVNVGGDLDREERAKYWAEREAYIGRWLKVRFLGYTEYGSLTSPQFMAFV